MAKKKEKETKKETKPHRLRAWKSMRVMRNFSLASLIQTSALDYTPAMRRDLITWLRRLAVHGFIDQTGPARIFRAAGDYGNYRISRARSVSPLPPVVCELCGEAITVKFCAALDKEREKEREREREREQKDLEAAAEAVPKLDAMLREVPNDAA